MPTPNELEMAKEGAKAAIQMARDYADALLKPSLNEIGGILSDTVGQWRLRNQAKMLLKTKEILEQHNIDPSKMLPDIFVPLVEESGNTQDELLSDMFASLLASQAVEPDKGSHPAYAKILGQLSPTDARVCLLLALCAKSFVPTDKRADMLLAFTLQWIAQEAHREYMPSCINELDAGVIKRGLLNFLRLGLVREQDSVRQQHPIARLDIDNSTGDADPVSAWFPIYAEETFVLTAFGQQFMLACELFVDTAEYDIAVANILPK